ncbi:MAG TPA: 3-deoxy-D-manno-octulosonic acid transferase [Planctomycetota bacterium]|nr:3-deoxy-D-manno-octulosonic acid transferase [Planctomycetota bacterium]
MIRTLGVWPRAARAAYSLLLRIGLPLYLLRVLWRGRSEPLYATAIGERIGRYRTAAKPGALWIHAVSLGETRAAAPLIDALRAVLPGCALLLTHGTATGRSAGQPLLRDGDAQAWLPFDTPGAVRRFFEHFAPVAGVLMETEIWPNLLARAQARGVPMLLANARLSERSRRRGQRVDLLLRPAFESLAAAFAQTEADAARLREAGAQTVSVEGNLKFDLAPDPRLLERGRRWKAAVASRGVVLAAVTREGEEATLLVAWHGVALPRPLLVIVPRHPQRFEAVAELIAGAGFALSRRSAWRETPPEAAATADLWLGDSMQEMPAWYALAEVALLGGSFAPLGGQNLIEAAACGCPVVMGPHTFNFKQAAELALAAGAATRVADMAGGVAAALALTGGAGGALREEQSRHALAFAQRHRGAAARMASRILATTSSTRGAAA